MKGLVIVICTLLLSSTGFAQSHKIVNGKVFLDAGELDKAKAALDAAVVHKKTLYSAKAWKYRGDVYYAIEFSKEEKYSSLSDNALQVAFDSYSMVDKCTYPGNYKDEVTTLLVFLENVALNKGVIKFNAEDYAGAQADFSLTIDIGESLDLVDTLAYYNCALSYERMYNYTSAIKYYEKCLNFNYRVEAMYQFVLFCYLQLDDNAGYTSTLDRSLVQFPESPELLTTKMNALLGNGEYGKAITYLDQLIEADPENPLYFFAKGSTLENTGNQSEAIESYLKAIELNSDYFEPNYNLGALYYNGAVELYGQETEEWSKAEIEKLNEVVEVQFNNSIGYLETAHRLRPEDRNTMNSLLQLYARNGQTENYQKIKKALGK